MEKILLLEGIHPNAIEILEKEGFQVELEKSAFNGKDLIERAQGYQALGIRSKTQLTQEVIKSLPELRVIGAFCIGINQIDLETSNICGIPAFNAPYSNTRSVAELVISEMIALARKLGDVNMMAHKGQWLKSANGNHEIRGKTLGIVGYGHIGSQVSVLAEAMGLKVLYFDILKKLPLGNARSMDSLDELLGLSDFVTLHVPETPMTTNLMSSHQLNKMKKGSFLINASRGTVVDIPDLVTALKTQHLAGAAIDVYPKEPDSNNESFTSELQNLENVILTPHIGGSTEEAQQAIGCEVAESLIRYLKFSFTGGAVNFPNLEVPMHIDGHRLMNVHKNVPGVMREINSIVSDVGANIRSQYLATDANIGYVVMDMEKGHFKEAAKKIAALPTSIKTQVH
ncbi:MAG: phosphoglycerate dehydrogenase [Bdellovibrionaceae bacterium]|nr:phosphoglycerate dehydrogenase [Pseudobdellovibrionaceae bacterium]